MADLPTREECLRRAVACLTEPRTAVTAARLDLEVADRWLAFAAALAADPPAPTLPLGFDPAAVAAVLDGLARGAPSVYVAAAIPTPTENGEPAWLRTQAAALRALGGAS